MKYGYVQHNNAKYDLLVPHVEEYSSSPTLSKADPRQMKNEIRLAAIKAKVASVPLHVTFG